MDTLREVLDPHFLLRNSVYASLLVGFACPLLGHAKRWPLDVPPVWRVPARIPQTRTAPRGIPTRTLLSRSIP